MQFNARRCRDALNIKIIKTIIKLKYYNTYVKDTLSLSNMKPYCDQGYPAVSTRGPVCFDCQQVSHPTLCDTIRVCDKNQVKA